MVTLKEVVQLESLKHFQNIAGSDPFMRPVVNVAIMDYEPITQHYHVFLKDEFILTSMLFAKDDPRLANEAIQALIQQEVTAIAIKLVYDLKLDDETLQMANDHQVAIFLYQEIYMEDIISDIKELLRHDADEQRYTAMLRKLSGENNQEEQELCRALIPQSWEQIQVAMLASAEDSVCHIRQLRNHLPDTCRVYLLDACILFIARVQKDTLLQDILRRSGISYQKAGISECVSVAQLKLALRQSACALQEASPEEICYFDQLDEQVFKSAVKDDEMIQQYCLKQLHKLERYDIENGSSLLETLNVYIRQHGDVKACSSALFQHPNTIRYRIAKVKRILNKEDMEEKAFYEYLFLLIFLSNR